jgi:predicted N-acetyltransferase YhbS
MNITIRSEQIADYNQIAEITTLAFHSMLDDATQRTFLQEMMIVDVQRHGELYDPELALVAEIDGRVVGHAFFYPYRMLIGGEELKAVSLAPISVHPSFQKQGIGIQLMEEGHRRARAKGYVFAFLFGHPSYYPRVGYIMDMFGKCQLVIPIKSIPETEPFVEARLVLSEDIEILVSIWHKWFSDVDLAAFPGNTLIEWVTHHGGIMSYTMTLDGEVIGYLRYDKQNPANVRLFLAKDKKSVALLLAYLRSKIDQNQVEHIRLPLHPNAKAVRECLTVPYEAKIETWKAGMIKILDPGNKAITAYCDEVRAEKRQPGLIIYPPFLEEVS